MVLVSICIVVLFVCSTTPAAICFVLYNDSNLVDNIGYQVAISIFVRFPRFWHRIALESNFLWI